MLRRTKAQVAPELPARIEEDLHVELDGPQAALYRAELKRARQLALGITSKADLDRSRFNVLQSLLRLRQICCDPRLGASGNPKAKPGAKIEQLLEQIEPILSEGHKVLVFSQFVEMLGYIGEALTARGIDHLQLTGKTNDRQALVERFQSPDSPPVFLLSLKAAGSGLNLTAASYVILFDPWWNPAVEAQAIDRTHRIGQEKTVIAYRLIARDTIEEKIRALQTAKADVANAIVLEESLAKVLDVDSLRFLLAE
jgi:SNF2 family DNA or RNA helicase